MPPLNPIQKKQLHALYNKLNKAIDDGHPSPALKKLTQLHAKMPRDLNILMLMGKANGKLGRHAETIESYAKAVEIQPKDPEIRYKYASALHKGGRFDDSLLELERVLYYKPDHFYALRHKASALTDLDRVEEGFVALTALREAVKDQQLDPNQALALAVSTARHAPKQLDPIECIEEIKRHLDGATEIGFIKAAHFQTGRLYHHLKRYDDAFASYTACKDVERQPWDPDEHSRRIDRLIACWRTDEPIPFSGVDGSRLIFVLGMMRSGTSLTEQMLAQVPGICPGGELNAISRQIPVGEATNMKQGRAMPLTRSLYTVPTLNKMARAAMKMYNGVSRREIVTDKQPYNYTCVPLIAHMLPGARVIHCVREPLDCCLSNYTQAFARNHMQTHDLYWLGRYYADYERVMRAWHRAAGVEMIDLHYEELVSDPETQSRRVMEFLGLPWTEEILRFHESDRTVNTASRDQVRRPMYTTAVKRYLPYEHLLGELKRGLAEGRARNERTERAEPGEPGDGDGDGGGKPPA